MTILSESTVKCATFLGYSLFIIAFMLTILAINMIHYDNFKTGLGFIIFAILLFVISIFCCLEPHHEIKVLLSDDYPAVKLYDKYDIKERDGNIWILREKEALKED